MRRLIFVFSLWMVVAGAQAQTFTTFILVRHAEKVNDGSKDPALTEAGKSRALSLAQLLRETKVDVIYSTPYVRTQSTVMPLANAKGLTVQHYDPSKMDFIDAILQQHAGGTVVICGHSNTTPGVANYLLGKAELKNYDDQDYDNILMVTVTEKGKGKLVWLNY